MAGRLKQTIERIISARLDQVGNPTDPEKAQFIVRVTLIRISMKVGRDVSTFTADTPDDSVVEQKIINAVKELGIIQTENDLEKYDVSVPLSDSLPPNPVRFKYKLKQRSMITINIFNTSSEFVYNLLNEMKDPGEYRVLWDTKNVEGEQMPKGEYDLQIMINYKAMKKIRFQLK